MLIRYLVLAATLIIFLTGSLSGCRHSSSDDGPPDLSSYHPEPTPANDFERKLKFIREGHFAHVWVITRSDGGAFTKEDGELIHTQAPKIVDIVAVDIPGTSEHKQFIAGSNFDVEPKQMAALKKRLKFEDYTGK